MSPAEVLLIWKHPISRERFVIARLDRGEQGYRFQYETAQPYSLEAAKQAGFTPLDPFSDETKVHISPDLFPIFERRLPPDWRSSEYQKLGLEKGQDIEYLRQSGGRIEGDTLEFLEPLVECDGATELELEFPVAGWRYYDGDQVLDSLQPGAPLKLELEPENKHDPNAIRVLTPDGTMLGYVPRIYAWYFDDAVGEHRYTASVTNTGSPTDRVLGVRVSLVVGSSDRGFRRVPQGLSALAAV